MSSGFKSKNIVVTDLSASSEDYSEEAVPEQEPPSSLSKLN